jgi:hypothetical protein
MLGTTFLARGWCTDWQSAGEFAMHEIENEIARLQLRSEQILIHLQQVPFGSREAVAARRNLGRMARMLVALKGERDQRQRELERAAQQISVAQRHGIAGS